jgi:hypothetical protein
LKSYDQSPTPHSQVRALWNEGEHKDIHLL